MSFFTDKTRCKRTSTFLFYHFVNLNVFKFGPLKSVMSSDISKFHYEVENNNWLDVFLNHGNPTHEQKTTTYILYALFFLYYIH